MSVSYLASRVRYGARDAVLKARLFSQQDSLMVNEMAECGAEGELPQRRLGVKEQQNGELTGKKQKTTNIQLSNRSNLCLKILFYECIGTKVPVKRCES